MSYRQRRILLDAICYGTCEQVKGYLKYCRNEEMKVRVLREAVIYERADIIEFLLDNGVLIDNVKTRYTQAQIDRAFHRCRSVHICEIFLRLGADVNVYYDQDHDDETALQHATSSGDLEMMRLLITYGADPNIFCRVTASPLETAISFEEETLVRFLLDSGASVNVHSMGQSPLKEAAAVGNVKFVSWLLERGAYVNRGPNKRAILHAVINLRSGCLADRIAIVQRLINEGFDWKRKCPISFAIKFNCLPLVKIFLRAGVDMTYAKGNLLHFAALYGEGFCIEEIVDELLKYGADLNGRNHSNRTPLAVSFCVGNALVLLRKMISRNVPISDYDFIRLQTKFRRDFKTELTVLRGKMIGDSCISFYNFCFKNNNSVAKVLRNRQIKQVLASKAYEETFPAFAPLIHHNFKKGTDQRDFLDRGIVKFVNLIPEGHWLSLQIVEEILSYLDGGELEVFVES